MLKEIQGLHHVTSMADDPNRNNTFFTQVLGLRRVKKTVNFDAPDIYHLYYGDEFGTPGSVMTYFPFPGMARGRKGIGEVGTTVFSAPNGALEFWKDRLIASKIEGISESVRFGEKRLSFQGPDGDEFAIVETDGDDRIPWVIEGVGNDVAIRGFHSTSMRLGSEEAMTELLSFMNYTHVDSKDGITRVGVEGGNGANFIDMEIHPTANPSGQGAGSVHHIAFSVENRDAQARVRDALIDTGYAVTPVIDRDYFWAIYFRTPGGILFEVATDEPGFDRDEDAANLGENLKLPSQHEHLRDRLEKSLLPITD